MEAPLRSPMRTSSEPEALPISVERAMKALKARKERKERIAKRRASRN